jgi:hypothetical protein
LNFDDQLRRYFGSVDLQSLSPEALDAGVERIQVDLGLERDRDRRFALWALLYLLGQSPELDAVFSHAEDRDAARNFMDLMDQTE